MAAEKDPTSDVENVLKGFRLITVTTTFATERMIEEAKADPQKRKQIFQNFLSYFRDKESDPWIYEPAILDNYGVFDDFARSVIARHNYVGEQNIVMHMENPYMVGSLLADPEHGSMLLWPGYRGYEWVNKCESWEQFAQKCVGRDNTGMPTLEKGTDITSRLWLAYATLRNYYNPKVNPHFDKLFPQWREASLFLDGMLLGRDEEIDADRLRGRNHYLDRILPYVSNLQKREEIQSIIAANPSLVQKVK